MAVLDWLQQMLGGGDPEAQGVAQTSSAMQPVADSFADWRNRGGLAGMMGMTPFDEQFAMSSAQQQPLIEQKRYGAATLAGMDNPMLGLGVGSLKGPIRAYHGSPYSFDRFDPAKIGTGEGAQAYGHGLYFAENEGVARGYRDALSGRGVKIGDDFRSVDPSSAEDVALAHLEPFGNQPDRFDLARKSIQDAMSRFPRSGSWAPVNLAINKWERASAVPSSSGKMYEVDLHADPEAFLNWDKPLSNQSPQIRQTLQDMGLINPRSEHLSALQRAATSTGEDIYQQIIDRLSPTGLSRLNAPPQASAALVEQGIPGIRYLDQGSRNAGGWHITPPNQTASGKWMVKSSDYNSKGLHFDTEAEAQAALNEKIGGQTHNYVVFNPKIIEIMRKYGLVGPLAAGGGAAAFGGREPDT